MTHKGETSFFYGLDAFVRAMDAAQHGDLINLSAGSFLKTDITKAVTIQGAGMTGGQQTSIYGNGNLDDMRISIPLDVTQSVKLEGLNFSSMGNTMISKNFNNGLIQKCRFQSLWFTDTCVQCYNVKLINVVCDHYNKPIDGSALVIHGAEGDITCYNSVFIGNDNYYSLLNSFGYTPIIFVNCVLSSPEIIDINEKTSFVNSIIYAAGHTLEYGSLTNCLLVDTPVSENVPARNNQSMSNLSETFKTFTGNYSESEMFELTAAGKAIQGNDGKEVGVYGGLVPYNVNPSYPRISALQVGNEVSSDGILDISIEVKSMNDAE